jgi:hypothetical protein
MVRLWVPVSGVMIRLWVPVSGVMVRLWVHVSGVKRRAARHTMNNYRNISSVNTMIDTLGWPTLAERRVKTRLIMFYKIII